MPDLGLELVWVAPGSFQMGSNDGQPDEKPVHAVRISRGFWMGKYEVTQAEYQAVTRKNPSQVRDLRNPVETVSSGEAAVFCSALTERERKAVRLPEGYELRLPTEAEWEYAARGGAGSKGFPYAGSDTPDDVAWYLHRGGAAACPVGQKRPNELGLYDMSGNVYEWCLDWYDGGYYAKSPGADPANLQRAVRRVARGGGWHDGFGYLRSTARFGVGPEEATFSRGFRVCLAPVIGGR